MEKTSVMELHFMGILIMTKFTFHIVSLPHTQVTLEYNHCAYTEKVRKFANMMKSLGHDVYVYASEENDSNGELVTCITKKEQKRFFGEYDNKKEFFNITWGIEDEHWQLMNGNAINEIKKRIKPNDYICLIAGLCQEQIAKAFPQNISVEFGIGYEGVFSPFKIFESYGWMHYVYGRRGQNDGLFYDAVIPNYFEVDQFPLVSNNDQKYCLFLGRFIKRKGIELAVEATKRAKMKLIIAGQGVERVEGHKLIGKELTIDEPHVSYVGYADVEKRAKLFGNALCTFVPTFYIEPFGGVSVESLLTGTPVIASDFGAFPENIRNGIDGYRYRTVGEAVEAIKLCRKLDRITISRDAIKRFGTNNVKYMYQAYFEQMNTLSEAGWYSDWSGLKYDRYL
jgi:glycosyltransferase involved in cell wall biosynthesis